MTRRFTLLLGAFALTSAIGADVAEAGRARFSGSVSFGRGWSGGVRVTSAARWHWSRPAWRPNRWSVGGSIYVGPRYVYYPRPYYYYYYQPEAVPSYYNGSYYPVTASAAPGVYAAAPTRPELPRFGVGLFMGGSSVEDRNESQDVGALGRFRLTPGLILEGEIAKTSYQDDLRVDRKLGASLIYEIGAYNKLAPYVLAGMGVQQAEVNGDYATTQDFAELGLGLRYAVSPSFHLTFDVRAGSRATVSNDEVPPPASTTARTIAPPTSSSGEGEEYTRARLSAILYF